MYRLPIGLYRAGLGAVMGDRFLHLTHTGRKTGLLREAVIEVVVFDPQADIYYLASGWGKQSDWYQNILATPSIVAQVGRRKFNGRAVPETAEKGADLFAHYGERHPRALQTLARVMGYRIDATEDEYRALGREVPVVAVHVHTT
jgi:deazaflavin-dependent oxidoreductase (nitroreductase family)